MNQKVLTVLEYNKIIDKLAEYATSDPGRDMIYYSRCPVSMKNGWGKAGPPCPERKKGLTKSGSCEGMGMRMPVFFGVPVRRSVSR